MTFGGALGQRLFARAPFLSSCQVVWAPGHLCVLPDYNHLVVENGFDFEIAPPVFPRDNRSLPGNQQPQFPSPYILGKPDFDSKWAHWNELGHRLAPGAGVREIHQVQNEAVGLAIKVAVNDAGGP